MERDYYAQTQKEFDKLVADTETKGYYKIQEMTDSNGKETGRGVYCSIDIEYRHGKCGYCGAIIPVRGIFSQGRKCDVCGKLIHLNKKKGDLVSFRFNEDDDAFFGDVITLRLAETPPDSEEYYVFSSTIPIHQYRHYLNTTRKQVLVKLFSIKSTLPGEEVC